jgi:hypothetical protein
MKNALDLVQLWFLIRLVRAAIWLNAQAQPPNWARQDSKLREALAWLNVARACVRVAIAIERWNKARQTS